jgi:tetratricopeptide (TPR) repeat protein
MRKTWALSAIGALTLISCTHDVQPLLERANALRYAGDLDSALALFDQVLTQEPTSSIAYNGRGLVKKLLGDTIGALADYNKAIQLDSNYHSAYNNRGVLLDDRGDHEGALSDLNAALHGNEDDHLTLFNRAVVRIHAHDYPGALGDFGKIRSLGVVDQYPRVFYQEGLAYASLDSPALAEARFNEYMKRDPEGCAYNACLVNRAINRISLGMYDSGYAELKRAEMLGNRNYEVLYHQGFALQYLTRYGDAVDAYNQAITFDSTDCCTFWYLGECKEKTGDKIGACSAYQRAVDLGHKDVNGILPKLCARK